MSQQLHRNAAVLALLCLLFTAACGGAEKKKSYKLPGATDFVVGDIIVEGVEVLDQSVLEDGLVTQEDPGWRADISGVPILGAPRQYFNYIEWERDLQRIITHYHANGYFDARIATKNVVQNAKDKSVRLKISIYEGKPTQFSEITLNGIEDPEIRKRLENALKIKVGDRFRQDNYLAAKNALVLELRRQSYAYAQVRGRVTVDMQERKAAVDFFLDAGPKSVFGPVTIEGLNRVDEEFIHTALTFKEGEPFTPDALQETQDDIYDLRAFTVVKIVGELEIPSEVVEEAQEEEEEEEEGLGISALLDDAQESAETRSELNPVVPIKIRVKEAKQWNLRVGVEAEIEVNRQSVQARLDWSNPNLLGGLRRVEHLNALGYAWAPSVFEPDNSGILVDSELRVTQPQFLERRTSLKSSIRFERDVFQGYNIVTPSFRLGFVRPFGKWLTVELSYNFSLNKLTEIDASLIESDVFVEDYILEYFEQRVRVDFRNEILNPSSGWMVEFILQEAMQIFWLGERDYFKPVIAGEFYIPYVLGLNQVFAGRARLGSTYSYGRPGGVPIAEKLYSGGVDSQRSFGRQEVSYWTSAGDAFPIGASSQLEFAVESRWRLVRKLLDVGDLWLALFLDAASVQNGQLYADTGSNLFGVTTISDLANSLVWGAGLGMYWVTPIGPLRIDVAYTLSDLTEDERFRRCVTEEPTCDSSQWVPLAEDPIQERVNGFSFFFGIGHSF